MKKLGLLATISAILIAGVTANAGFRGYNTAGDDLGVFSDVQCSTGMTCTKSGRRLNIVSSPTLTSDLVVSGTTPYITLGDAGAEDTGLIYDGNAVDFNISLDDSADKLVIGLGSAAGTTNRMSFNSADLNVVLGDTTAADVSLVFDGNAQDFHVGLDDSTDDLVIGLGTAPGTTDAIRIDENQNVTFVQNVVGLGTDSLSGFLQKQVASTTTGITAAQCGSTFVSNSADVMTLPEASTVLGCRLTFISGTADDFDINPADGTDQIGPALNSVAGGTGAAITPSAGDAIRITDIGSSVTLEAVGNDLWAPVGVANGAVTDVN